MEEQQTDIKKELERVLIGFSIRSKNKTYVVKHIDEDNKRIHIKEIKMRVR